VELSNGGVMKNKIANPKYQINNNDQNRQSRKKSEILLGVILANAGIQ
jgi:hypothetical protein